MCQLLDKGCSKPYTGLLTIDNWYPWSVIAKGSSVPLTNKNGLEQEFCLSCQNDSGTTNKEIQFLQQSFTCQLKLSILSEWNNVHEFDYQRHKDLTEIGNKELIFKNEDSKNCPLDKCYIHKVGCQENISETIGQNVVVDIYKTGSLKVKQDVPDGYELDLCYTCEGGSGVNKYSIEYDNIKIV